MMCAATSFHWPSSPLADLAEIFLGLAASRRAAAEETQVHDVPLINVRDLDNGRVAPLGLLESRCLPLGYPIEQYRVSTGDILVTCRGSQLKLARVGEDTRGALISSNLIGIRPGPDLLPQVLFTFLNSAHGQAALLSRSRSSTLTLALSPKSVRRIEVPVPPTEVQRQIASLTSAAEDNYVAALRAGEQRRAVAHHVANRLLSGELAYEPSERD